MFLRIALSTLLLFFSLSSQAVVEHIVSGSKLTRANNIAVGGLLYNVEFLEGTLVDHYGGVIPAFHNTEVAARSFAQALLDQVFIDMTLGNFGTQSSLTNGCTGIDPGCSVLIPFEYFVTTSEYRLAESFNQNNNSFDNIFVYNFIGDFDNGRTSVARFSLSAVSAIPEPQTYVLLMVGLTVLVSVKRQRSRS